MILSIRVKTAGSGFRRIRARIFERDFLLKYREMADTQGPVVTAIPDKIRCIHGHFVPDVLLPQYPEATLITRVRDPVERVDSSYSHHLRHPGWRRPVNREIHEKN